jgi:hypothetical protein
MHGEELKKCMDCEDGIWYGGMKATGRNQSIRHVKDGR